MHFPYFYIYLKKKTLLNLIFIKSQNDYAFSYCQNNTVIPKFKFFS